MLADELIQKNKTKQAPLPDEDEETLMYRPAERRKYLNDSDDVFTQKDVKSLNTAPSVFDRGAVFKSVRTDG
ncbi:MAG: hypothetical protein K6A72_08215 [Lachnospiraceae bacterium]|nr:hypothetical protein [Lachnospiraceae bacterium]